MRYGNKISLVTLEADKSSVEEDELVTRQFYKHEYITFIRCAIGSPLL